MEGVCLRPMVLLTMPVRVEAEVGSVVVEGVVRVDVEVEDVVVVEGEEVMVVVAAAVEAEGAVEAVVVIVVAVVVGAAEEADVVEVEAQRYGQFVGQSLYVDAIRSHYLLTDKFYDFLCDLSQRESIMATGVFPLLRPSVELQHC